MIWLFILLSILGNFLLTNLSIPFEGAGVQLFSPDRQSTLLVQGKKSKRWGWTKGHREDVDATWLDTAIREVKEESGFEVDRDYWICTKEPFQWGKRLYWQGITFEKKPIPFHNALEHANISWFTNDQLSSLLLGKDVIEWQMFSNKVYCDIDYSLIQNQPSI